MAFCYRSNNLGRLWPIHIRFFYNIKQLFGNMRMYIVAPLLAVIYVERKDIRWLSLVDSSVIEIRFNRRTD